MIQIGRGSPTGGNAYTTGGWRNSWWNAEGLSTVIVELSKADLITRDRTNANSWLNALASDERTVGRMLINDLDAAFVDYEKSGRGFAKRSRNGELRRAFVTDPPGLRRIGSRCWSPAEPGGGG